MSFITLVKSCVYVGASPHVFHAWRRTHTPVAWRLQTLTSFFCQARDERIIFCYSFVDTLDCEYLAVTCCHMKVVWQHRLHKTRPCEGCGHHHCEESINRWIENYELNCNYQITWYWHKWWMTMDINGCSFIYLFFRLSSAGRAVPVTSTSWSLKPPESAGECWC